MMTGNGILGMTGNYLNMMAWPTVGSPWTSWFMGPLMWTFIAFFSVLILGIWIYTSFAYMEIGKKLKFKKPWMAWIPFARGAMILQLGKFDWRWIFLLAPNVLLLPLAFIGGWGILYAGLSAVGSLTFSVFCFTSHWRFFEKRNYMGWLALVPLAGIVISYLFIPAWIAFLVILGFVAWEDRKPMRKTKRQSV